MKGTRIIALLLTVPILVALVYFYWIGCTHR